MSDPTNKDTAPSSAICPVGLESMSQVGEECTIHEGAVAADRRRYFEYVRRSDTTHQRNTGPTTF